MNCDMCGREAEMFKAVIEGSEMSVCSECAKYGHVVGKLQIEAVEPKRPQIQAKAEAVEAVVNNFGQLLKRKREQLGLSQKEFAKKIAEKESTLHKLETGTIAPQIERARKLEKMLGLKLVEEVQDMQFSRKGSSAVVTLGDMVKIKKRR
ncbi:TIGR00270 family protein [Candidatus Woesearchaeota archaeon]|nr:TIGR00270 family protein [Candidatus Woesearchaeota archaeon]